MRIALVLAAVIALGATAVAAPAGHLPQAQTFNRDPKTCTDAKLEPKFLSDWWYDLDAASAEHRITLAQRDAIQAEMTKLLNAFMMRGANVPPADVVAFCARLNKLRPHWSRN